jgi:hypothetical protein
MKLPTLTNSLSAPARLLHEPKDWLPLKEAAHLLQVSRRTVLRMTETIDRQTGRAYLRTWRPTPGVIMVGRSSLEEFCRLTQSDPDSWLKRARESRGLSASATIRPIRCRPSHRPRKPGND